MNVGADTFLGKQDKGTIVGGGASYGFGAGAATFVGPTWTFLN